MDESTAPLKLRAIDLDDLSVVSGMVQDALVPLADIAYLPGDGQLVLALNRFRWEKAGDAPPYSRIHAGLRFDNVTNVSRKGISTQEKDRILDLLAIAFDAKDEDGKSGAGTVLLQFAGDVAIRLEVSSLACALEDLGEPWPTQWKPGHQA